jgi:hypothetical protein
LKVVLLVPRLHFHAPFVLRALLDRPRGGSDRYLTVVTPKLPAREEPLWRKVGRILRTSGLDYLLSMSRAAALHMAGERWERLLMQPLEERRFLSVEEVCGLLGAEVIRAPSVRDPAVRRRLEEFQPDLLSAVFFNQIVPPELLELPRLGALNVHPSYLPHYRGVSPCFWALARGEASSGVTIHRMTAEIDRGPILARRKVEITAGDSLHSLYRRSALLAGELLRELLDHPERLEEPAGEPAPEEEGSSFAGITRAAVRDFRSQGRSFF